ncbi:MAG TPA: MarR family transcriptional regulator [Steroidobacteraceae bacterium]|jgi:DNA-binding MarR family transcriptional regulator|nr:MarR family transcriptional regulator [Steroidobacteraceae bacterium]
MSETYYTIDSLQAANSVGYMIKRCGVLMNQIAEERFESQSISFTQWVVLAQLAQHPHLTPTELSTHLGHDMGALTRLVDDLQQKKLVRRERSEEDRRAVRITVTAEGRRLAKTAKVPVLELANRLVEPYSRAETELLISLLQRLLAHMESVAEQPVRPQSSAARARQSGARRRTR